MQRSEQAFFKVRAAMEAGAPSWSKLAQDAGYADQAHFCREARRVTCFSPQALRRHIEQDEAFWLCRIWN